MKCPLRLRNRDIEAGIRAMLGDTTEEKNPRGRGRPQPAMPRPPKPSGVGLGARLSAADIMKWGNASEEERCV